MSKTIKDLATDPLQYDRGEVVWAEEGHELSPVRRMFLESLQPYIDTAKNKSVLDIGCGQGWLVAEFQKRGADVIGIDPSELNLKIAKSLYTAIDFRLSDLDGLELDKKFDLITTVMVLEHFADLGKSYEKIKSLLKKNGELLVITSDFNKAINSRNKYTVEIEEVGSGEIATRTDYGERAGVLCDINRTTELVVNTAKTAGFNLVAHEPITAPQWLLKEEPRYEVHEGRPLFHLFIFSNG